MKKGIKIICSCFLILSLFGCAKEQDFAKQSQKYAWVLATSSPADTVTGIFAQKFADEVYRLSDGQMVIQVYDNSTLGGDRELLESCQNMDVKFIVQNTAPQVSFMPELAIFDLPMAYDNIEDIRMALDDEQFSMVLNDVYQEAGFRLLAMADQSFRVMTTNKNIHSYEDFKGQKIRTMENSNHLAFWKAIEANPSPMTFSEVYIGLQQGTIDAQENPIEVIVSSKLYEQQDFIVETNHLAHLLSLITNDDFYNQLTKQQQAIIDQASLNAKEYARQKSDERIDSRLDIIIDSGTQVVTLDEEMKQKIRQASMPLYDSIEKQVGSTIFEAYLKYATWRENENN